MRARSGLAAMLVAAACGHGDRTADQIRAALARELGEPVRTVRCHRDRCEAVTAAGLTVPITLTAGAPRTWTTAPLIDPRPVAAEVQAALASVGAAQAVDCGGLRLADEGAARIECALGGGGAAFATVGVDGAVDVELALTAAVAAARRDPVDPATLEQASRALDTDEAEGSEDEADDADAGVGDDGGVDAILPGPGG